MIMPGDFVIAGVSGGADSVCLFFELLAYQKEIPFSMEVVHIEHGIRGQDSLADANYVENLCKEYGVPFHLVSCDIKKMAQESSLTARGIKTATITAETSITLDAPKVECTQLLKTKTFELTSGGTMKGNVKHSGGSLESNGITVHTHVHSGVKSGSDTSGGPQ